MIEKDPVLEIWGSFQSFNPEAWTQSNPNFNVDRALVPQQISFEGLELGCDKLNTVWLVYRGAFTYLTQYVYKHYVF